MHGNFQVSGAFAIPMFIMFAMGLALCLAGGSYLTALIFDRLMDKVFRSLRLGREIVAFAVARSMYRGTTAVELAAKNALLQSDKQKLQGDLAAADWHADKLRESLVKFVQVYTLDASPGVSFDDLEEAKKLLSLTKKD